MVGNIAGGGGGAVNAGKNGDEIPCAELAVTSIVIPGKFGFQHRENNRFQRHRWRSDARVWTHETPRYGCGHVGLGE